LQIVATIDNTITGTKTLTNNVYVSGKPTNGQNVTSKASADVRAEEAKITVSKTANPTTGTPGTSVTFTLVVNNTGSSDLPHVFVSDLLPLGMSYIASSSGGINVGQNVYWSDIGPILPGGRNVGHNVSWSDVGPILPADSKKLRIAAYIDGSVSGTQTLTNNVDVSGKPAHGQNVTAKAFADVQAQEAKIKVTKIPIPTAGSPGTDVTFTLLVENTGSAVLQHVFVSDLLPVGMTYVSSSNPAGTNV
jgi:uncharacterized repeat protein (TIGR01451 family)